MRPAVRTNYMLMIQVVRVKLTMLQRDLGVVMQGEKRYPGTRGEVVLFYATVFVCCHRGCFTRRSPTRHQNQSR